ncbi:MAG TPA: UDP-N-acetylglucosamine--N-acetylmuramyl-(pentapeptide) pyrophosphoryl-undecaprenol N-acetylglucosamine transferase [Candidatus Sulfomarinibacteraceae bacterium]|nr:UDP-N-acetylglucosamine--N-acetylmuramyl-(pentapeptide) pyrophosphoryl-undecaprenol N-acetylglucosamine transferase [Candidatus Sulfomarinibacteraceae bacterium]
MRILVCGGGTGGHIYPALAAVNELRRQGYDSTQFLWIGTRGEMEEELVPRAGLRLETIQGGPIVGVSPRVSLVNGMKLTWSLGKTNSIWRAFRPDVLFMTGGYVNAPVALTAWLRRTPAAIFLPDVEPGSAIRFLSRFAQKVACTTPASQAYFRSGKTVVTGYPVRPQLREALALSRTEALGHFELEAGRRTLLVFGGSRGARSINRALLAVLPQLLESYQVLHISGALDWPEVEAAAQNVRDEQRRYYRPYAYLHERMGAALRAADLVVARAGASMLGESPAFALPAILVPYPHAWRYQKVNADYLAERGAAVRVDDELLPDRLLPVVRELLQDEARLTQMAAAAGALDRPQAASNLARLLQKLAQRHMGNNAW